MFQLKITQKKLESYQKNDKFVRSKIKICLFILFMKLVLNFRLIVFISQVILSENLLNKKKKMMQHRNRANMPQVILSSKVFAFSIDLQILGKPIQ